MRSVASFFLLLIIVYTIFVFFNNKLKNVKKFKRIKYRPIETNVLDLQFQMYKIK